MLRLTDTQAAAFCRQQAELSLASPGKTSDSHSWRQFSAEIEHEGLDAVEKRLLQWRNTPSSDPRRRDTHIADKFLDALTDRDEVMFAIASELKEQIDQEREQLDSTDELQSAYLQELHVHLNSVRNGSAELEEYEAVRTRLEGLLLRFEQEYGARITAAIRAQEH